MIDETLKLRQAQAARRNRRTAWMLGAVALLFFAAALFKQWVQGPL